MSKVLVSSAGTLQHLLAPKFKIDDRIARLHYVWTTRPLVIFAAFVLVVTSLKNSIVCYSNARAIPQAIINLYCWLLDINLLPDGLSGELGTDVAHPGVLKHSPGDARVYQRYYMWVPLMLIFQAATFYMTRLLWKEWEDGQVSHFVIGLERVIPIARIHGVEQPTFESPSEKDKKIEDTEVYKRYRLIGEHLATQWDDHAALFVQFLVCQVINFVNVVVQIFVLDYFFGGHFTTYGSSVFQISSMDVTNRTDPAVLLFPRMTKCSYRQYGFSGNVEHYDILCALPYNVYYEKMFIFLYFWYIILACLSALSVVFWFLIAAYGPMRKHMLDLNEEASDNSPQDRKPFKNIRSSSWFFLYLVLNNIDGYHNRHILREVLKNLNAKNANN